MEGEDRTKVSTSASAAVFQVPSQQRDVAEVGPKENIAHGPGHRDCTDQTVKGDIAGHTQQQRRRCSQPTGLPDQVGRCDRAGDRPNGWEQAQESVTAEPDAGAGDPPSTIEQARYGVQANEGFGI